MDSYRIGNVVNSFVGAPQAFTVEEALDFIDTNVDLEVLRAAFSKDSRFILLSSAERNDARFISKNTLFQWFINLNIRLAEIRLFKLTEKQLAFKINGLRTEGFWNHPPAEAIQWARSFGFISPCCTCDQYVFPLAWVLSFMQLRFINYAYDILSDFDVHEISRPYLEKLLEGFLREGFSIFHKRIVSVIQLREGLTKNKKITLEELGKSLKLTRERVRQIENKFWQKNGKHFLAAFLCDFIYESGSLVVSSDYFRQNIRKFLAKCVGIPQNKLSKTGLVILGDSSDIVSLSKKFSKLWYELVDAENLVKQLESKTNIFVVDSDIKILSERLVQLFRKRLRRNQRVYFALRTIGKPAHYSQVTEVHNELFSELPATEHTVHAVLSDQQYGIVWVGVRGTFALKEWGYKRPSRTLFNSVTEIVNKIYRQTGKPTPYTVIMSEMGKHRKLLNPSSIYIATHLNPDLKCISKELFVPKRRKDSAKAKDETSSDKLDKILQKFQGK